MITVDELKALTWKFTAHADGSDKGGRFSIDFYEAEFAGRKLRGSKKTWRSGQGESSYAVDGIAVGRLAEVAAHLNQRFTAGDDDAGEV
jgi:hypothetical protein